MHLFAPAPWLIYCSDAARPFFTAALFLPSQGRLHLLHDVLPEARAHGHRHAQGGRVLRVLLPHVPLVHVEAARERRRAVPGRQLARSSTLSARSSKGRPVQVFDLDSKAVHYESGVLNEIENSTFFCSK